MRAATQHLSAAMGSYRGRWLTVAAPVCRSRRSYAHIVTPLRYLLAIVVLTLLVRAGRVAWSRRNLAYDVWRTARPRHLLGATGMLVLVIATSYALIGLAPVLGRGLGDLFGSTGNAVFAPVDAAARATQVGTEAASRTGDVLYLLSITVFLGLLAMLLPWFAFVEEELFRAGSETWSTARRAVGALWFGSVHLVMLVPLAAALSIAVAGGVYGEVYRRGTRREARAPESLRLAFQPTKRSRASVVLAVEQARITASVPAGALPAGGLPSGGLPSEALTDDSTPDTMALEAHAARERQIRGLHASTVWHTVFNSLVVLLVWVSLVLETLS
ncbi:MAG: hypothetical protein ACI9OB_000237 [Nonlabens sp.]